MNPTNLVTPFARRVVNTEFPYIIEDNTNRYKMFALKTQMWPLLNDGEQVAYRKIQQGDDMVTVINVMLGSEPLHIPLKQQQFLQNFIDNFFDIDSDECLLYVTQDDRVLDWPFPENIEVHKTGDFVFANLSKVANYADVYDQLNLSIHFSLN